MYIHLSEVEARALKPGDEIFVPRGSKIVREVVSRIESLACGTFIIYHENGRESVSPCGTHVLNKRYTPTATILALAA